LVNPNLPADMNANAGQPKRVLGIDFGTSRIGISLSDPLLIIAQPYDTIRNDRGAMSTLSGIIEAEQVGLVIVGMPLNLKGEKGKKALEVEVFIEHLSRATQAEIVRWDERFSTRIAQRTLVDMGTKRQERRLDRGRIDAMAAAVLLQSYLDSRKRSLSC